MEELLKENKIKYKFILIRVDRVSETEIESLTQDMMHTITIFKGTTILKYLRMHKTLSLCIDIYWHKKTKSE